MPNDAIAKARRKGLIMQGTTASYGIKPNMKKHLVWVDRMQYRSLCGKRVTDTWSGDKIVRAEICSTCTAVLERYPPVAVA